MHNRCSFGVPAGVQGFVQSNIEHLQGWRFCDFSGPLLQYSNNSTKKVFLTTNWNVLYCSSWLLFLDPPLCKSKKSLDPSSVAPPVRDLKTPVRSSLLLLHAHYTKLSVSLYLPFFSPKPSYWPLLDSFQYLNAPLVLGSLGMDAASRHGLISVWSKEKHSFPWPACCSHTETAQNMVDLHWCSRNYLAWPATRLVEHWSLGIVFGWIES